MAFSAAKLQRQAEELDAELVAARYSAQSEDKMVTATVSGQGKLVDLVIADHALRSTHPHLLGPAVVAAVAAASRQASAASMTKLRAVLDKDQEWQPEAPSVRAAEPAARPAPRRADRAEDEDEESFEQLDFVTDSGERDDTGRGRW